MVFLGGVIVTVIGGFSADLPLALTGAAIVVIGLVCTKGK